MHPAEKMPQVSEQIPVQDAAMKLKILQVF